MHFPRTNNLSRVKIKKTKLWLDDQTAPFSYIIYFDGLSSYHTRDVEHHHQVLHKEPKENERERESEAESSCNVKSRMT